jgi:amino acid adenylation domain-containing protein
MSDRLQDLLSGSADAHGEAVAVVDGARMLTYSELDRRANQLAHLLLELGVSRGDRVGIHLEKSIESVLAIYGALKAGATYVPLDADAPDSRLGYIARDCEIHCVVTRLEEVSRSHGLIAAGAPIETIVVLNPGGETGDRPLGAHLVGSDALDSQPDTTPACAGVSDDLAYLLYTSGSTGTPKGVMLSHRNALSFVEWAAACVEVNATDRLSSHAPLHFDLSIFDLFATAQAGATVVLVRPGASRFPIELVRFIERTRITVWYSVPSVLSMVALRGGLTGSQLTQLRAVLFAGEVFPTKHLRRLMALLPRARFYNLYGPTETNVCTYYEVPQLPDDKVDAIPIGRAIANVEVFAVRDDGTPAPSGEVGELYVRGPTVMRGYWRSPDRTAAVLVPDPTRPDAGGLVYRTGDLVCEDADGNFLFLGRGDNQIKSRGYRIELGEIETTLLAHPAVVECAVIAIADELVTNRIRAFVVTDRQVNAAALVRFVGDRLPHYMIPESFDFLESLPKTSTGKTDRQRLPAKAGVST